MKTLSAKDKLEIATWVTEPECECNDDLKTYEKCCGNKEDVFQCWWDWANMIRIRPRFKTLAPEQQKKFLKDLEDKFRFDPIYHPLPTDSVEQMLEKKYMRRQKKLNSSATKAQ